jgi:bacterioferritin
MKGDKKLIEKLNQLLTEELTAISQYSVHAEMCANWGIDKLHEAKEGQARNEMKHAEELISRILFLEGLPVVSKLNAMTIGKTAQEMIKNDLQLELGAVRMYNQGIALAVEAADRGTGDLLLKILKDEEEHVDWAESQQSQIEQFGIQNYLANQA